MWGGVGRSKELLDGLYAKGFKRPSKIQAAALPIVLCKEKGMRNLIAQGQSGTGKTATYVLGMYSLVDPDVAVPQAICLEPTRELARQTFAVCKEIGKFTKVRAKLVIPGERCLSLSLSPSLSHPYLLCHKSHTYKQPHTHVYGTVPREGMFKEQVIVGTPGIVSEAVKRRCINPKMIVMLAVDEADHMLQENLGEQTSFIRSQLRPEAKVMLFSAVFFTCHR